MTSQWPPKKEEKKDAWLTCPKCGRVMDILFNVAKCPVCEKKHGEEQPTDTWQHQWKTARGIT